MIIHNLVQGSPEWKAFRAEHFTASDASAMLGFSKYKTRTQLLDEKVTGVIPEVNDSTQYLFDKGHAAEESARELLEKDSGEELFPLTGTHEKDLIIAASLDGKTDPILSDKNVIFEHKLYNESLIAYIKENKDLPDTHWPQVEQQLYVSGADHCIFMVSDGTEENCFHCKYKSNPKRIKSVLDGWRQFAIDMEAYEPSEVEIKAEGVKPEDLPALFINAVGEVKGTNLPEFKETALAVLESINRDLKTDEDFASAEKTVKWCQEVENDLGAAKKTALAQTQTIDELFRVVDELSEKTRSIRLELNKLVTERKKAIKIEIATNARKAVEDHHVEINQLCEGFLPLPATDFNSAMKNKRTISSLKESAEGEVVRAKIDIKNTADKIANNLVLFNSLDEKHTQLFADKNTLVLKDTDFVKLEIKSRVDLFDSAEAKRLEESKQEDQAAEKEPPTINVQPISKPAKTSNKTDYTPSAQELVLCVAESFSVDFIKAQAWLSQANFNQQLRESK